MHMTGLSSLLGGWLIYRFKRYVGKFLTPIPLGSSPEFWCANHPILISFHLLQFHPPYWTWLTITMALMGARL